MTANSNKLPTIHYHLSRSGFRLTKIYPYADKFIDDRGNVIYYISPFNHYLIFDRVGAKRFDGKIRTTKFLSDLLRALEL